MKGYIYQNKISWTHKIWWYSVNQNLVWKRQSITWDEMKTTLFRKYFPLNYDEIHDKYYTLILREHVDHQVQKFNLKIHYQLIENDSQAPSQFRAGSRVILEES